MRAATLRGTFGVIEAVQLTEAPVTEALSALGGPIMATTYDAARIHRLLADLRRLAVDQPVLEDRIVELSSLLSELMG
jgi:hypothetical protein